MIHTFGECEIDEELFQLRRQGRVVEIEPKVFDVLAYLIRHRGRVVSKDELLDALWPGVTVTESVLPHCVAAVRRAVGDDRARQKVIQTVHGRGYLFVASACSRPATPRSEDDPAGVARAAGLIPDRSTSSLPFVGRDQAMKQLAGRLESAFAGRGQLVLVVGEPGIGKTRVTEEFADETKRRKAVVLVGRCYEGGGAPAFWPWVQILRACLRAEIPRPLRWTWGPGRPRLQN